MNKNLSRVQSQSDEQSVRPVRLQQLDDRTGSGSPLFGGDFSIIKGVKVRIEVLVGYAEITVGELFSLQEHSVVKLNTLTDAPVEVRLDGNVIARGSLVVVDDNFGVAIEEILPSPNTDL